MKGRGKKNHRPIKTLGELGRAPPDELAVKAEPLSLSLREIGLPVELVRYFECEGICSVIDVCVRSVDELRQSRGFKEEWLSVVIDRLAVLGLQVGLQLKDR